MRFRSKQKWWFSARISPHDDTHCSGPEKNTEPRIQRVLSVIFSKSESGIKWQIISETLRSSAAFKHRERISSANQDIQHSKIKPQANERGSRRVILENSLEENSIFNLFWSRLSHLITVRIQSAFLKWLIVRGGEGTSMSGFGELSGVVPLTTSPATRRQHDTARCGSASSMSETVWRGKLEKNFLDIKYFLMWNQPTTKTSNGSQILIYSLDMFPAPL